MDIFSIQQEQNEGQEQKGQSKIAQICWQV